MPRSFLVKKYLKQKYESDFKLQQSLNGGSNNNNNDNDNSTSNIVSSISKDNTTIDNNKVKVQKLSDNIIARLQQQNDSGKAATPFTPSVAQPLAVRLSNGYILDVSQTSSARDEGVAESSHVVARTPHQEPESAAIENQQPRRSVIVTNTNHPANRNISNSNSSSRVASYNSSSNSNSFEGRYVVSSNSFLYKAPSPYHADTQTASLERPPPMAHMPSPPPAHAPVQSPLPAHTSNPSPAHTQMYTTHSPSPAHMPTPAHTKMRANSPIPAHVQPTRASSVPDVLPADHPIHHPLIQQLINQRLHVPEDNSYHHHSDNSNNHNNSIYHQPQHHQDTSYPGRSRSSSPPSYEDDNDSYYHTQAYSNDNLQRMHFTVVTQTNDNIINNSKPSENAITNQSQVLYTLSQPHHAISPTHLPPSPSPSLPSSSPTLPVVTSSLAHSPSPPSPAPSIPPPSPHTGSEVNSYTYEAFLVSDGRSRKRALDTSEDRSSSKVRYTCTECGKDYATSSNLSRHKQTHRSLDSKNAKKCPHCDKVYVSMPALSMHILTHDLKHPCTVCGKTFSRPWLLQGHMRSHTGEKPFGCAHCGKAFADRSNLRAHMQTHSAFKHFQCDKCNKNFALKSYLNKHLESACVKE